MWREVWHAQLVVSKAHLYCTALLILHCTALYCSLLQVGDVLDQCSAIVLKAGKEGQYEKEGYGQRPYDNWETVMIDCNGRVSVDGESCKCWLSI